MLDNVFMQVLDMTKTAGVVILAVLAARLLLKKAPKWISYALWAVVLVRLLCPLSIEAPVSAVPRMEPISETYSLADEPISVVGAAEAAGRAVGDALNGGLGVQHIRTTEKTDTGSAMYTNSQWWEVWVLFGGYVWLAGIAVMLIYSAVSYIRLRRKLVGAIPLRENIYLADHIASPFVMGLFRPKIYLPSAMREREQEYIILHERHHIRRIDHVFKALAFLALCVHWFNPLVWLAFVLAGKDMEMSCDEAVIKKLGADIRADYSASLLSLATGRRLIAGTPLAFGEGDTKSRIRNLAGWKKPVIWIVIIAVLLCAALAVCLLTDPLSNSDDTLKLTEFEPGSDISIEYEMDIGEAVKSGRITAELWQNGECVQSAPVTFTRFANRIELRIEPRRGGEDYTDVDVQISTDQYGGSLLTSFALPEYDNGLGWATMAHEKGEEISLKPGNAKVLAAVAFDFGNGVRGTDCITLENEPERLKEYEYIIVILAGFDAEELAPQTTDEAVSSSKEVLQLHHVIKLAEKKYELNWSDFEDFDYIETGSGLYIRRYPIDDTFSLWIGGGSPEVESRPYYIYLAAGDIDTRIDIRDGGVEEFIAEHSQSPDGDKTIGDGALERMGNLRAEDIKYISSHADVDPEAIAAAMNNAVAHRVDRDEGVTSFWDMTLYLTDIYSSNEEHFQLYAGLEENIIQLRYHDGHGTRSEYFFEDEELYLIIRDSYTREGLIEAEKLAEYNDIITARAEKNIRQNEQMYGQQPFTGYEITEFYEHDRFEDGSGQYTVYKWNVAFTVEDPMKVGWAGGMWLDSDLRVRAYEQCTYFVVRSVDGVVQDHSFLFWDLYNGAGDESEREYAWSEIQRIWRGLEIESFINAKPNNGFASMNFYENVWEAELYQLIYQCADESVAYEDVKAAYESELGAVHTDLSYISRDNLDKLLRRLTGYGLEDKEWNLGHTQYLESIDVYCIMHGDTNYDPLSLGYYTCEDGLYTVRFRRKLADAGASYSHIITLRDTGGGTYQFVSCQPGR